MSILLWLTFQLSSFYLQTSWNSFNYPLKPMVPQGPKLRRVAKIASGKVAKGTYKKELRINNIQRAFIMDQDTFMTLNVIALTEKLPPKSKEVLDELINFDFEDYISLNKIELRKFLTQAFLIGYDRGNIDREEMEVKECQKLE